MKYRRFGRTGWQVSEVGYGMWGIAGWTGSDDDDRSRALAAVGRARLQLLRHGVGVRRRAQRAAPRASWCARIRSRRLYAATKIPPKNRTWPSRARFPLDDVFPPDHIREYAETSLENLGLARIDLLQFHVWEDDWADDDRWQRAMDDLKREGLVGARRASASTAGSRGTACATLRTGLIDAVQVIYNIFDQAPEDELFPLCRELGVGVIARVPFDEGSLTGTLTKDIDVARGRLAPHLLRSGEPGARRWTAPTRSSRSCRRDSTMPEMALRFILANPDVARSSRGCGSRRT